MRRPSPASVPVTAGLVVAAATVLIGLPVVTAPAVAPKPVAPVTTSVALAPLPATGGLLADTGRRTTHRFALAGVTWRTGSLPAGAQVELRTRTTSGHWTSWTTLSLPDGGPDGGSRDAKAAAQRHVTATDPLWVGPSNGVQARVVDATGKSSARVPAGLQVVLVDGGTSPADATATNSNAPHDSAEAAMAQPTIYSRAQWGADERLRSRNSGCGTPDYASTIKMGFVHHTDNSNGYTSTQVPAIIRSIYAYHVESNGWCDIGYNFLVDRFGRIWEGRYGGIARPVIGAHTGGFNTNSFGASLIGNFTGTTPPTAMVSAVERLFAWKLGAYYRDPAATTTMVAGSFSGSRYATGSTVTFRVVSGHRDADTTTCPGSYAYAKLPAIRTAVRSLIGAGLVAPTIAPTTIRMASGQPVQVHSGVLTGQSWKLTVTDASGIVVKSLTGAASLSTPVSTSWDGTDSNGLPVLPGKYTVLLTSTTSTSTALPYATAITVTPPVTVSGPTQSGYDQQVALTGTAPTGTQVTLNLSRDGIALAPQTFTTDKPTWSSTFTADADYTWTASANGYTTPSHTTQVVPIVATPTSTNGNAFVPAGSSVALTGSALPAVAPTVTVATTPTGQSTTNTPVAVAADGSWSTVLTPTAPTAVVVSDGRGAHSTPLTVYPVTAPSATAPTTGYAMRHLVVSGNAGGGPLKVRVSSRLPGASTYALTTTVTADRMGKYSAVLTLPNVSSTSTFGWQVSTGFGHDVTGSTSVAPVFAPTATGPKVGHYGVAAIFTGRAVPGDVVSVAVHAVGATRFSRAASTTADASTGAFRLTYVLRNDVVWHVTSPSGATSPATIVVAPTIGAPALVARTTTVRFAGTGIPGQKVALYQRVHGTTTRSVVAVAIVNSYGKWYAYRRVDHTSDFWAVSHLQRSRTITVSTR